MYIAFSIIERAIGIYFVEGGWLWFIIVCRLVMVYYSL